MTPRMGGRHEDILVAEGGVAGLQSVVLAATFSVGVSSGASSVSTAVSILDGFGVQSLLTEDCPATIPVPVFEIVCVGVESGGVDEPLLSTAISAVPSKYGIGSTGFL